MIRLLAALACAALAFHVEAQERLLVFAAASLKTALDAVAAAWRGERWRSEEEDEEQCGERALYHRSSFTVPFVPAQAGIHDVQK